jgi:Co/Zn/Cd efflux system component
VAESPQCTISTFWTITSGLDALGAHLVLAPGTNLEAGWPLVQAIRDRLRRDFNIGHATLQVEPPDTAAEPGAF